MRLLITRPTLQAAETLSALQARGWQGVVSPLMEIEQIRSDNWPNWTRVSGIVITSSNAIPALSASGAPASAPIFCVGARTAAAIEAAGYANVILTAATAAELATHLAESVSVADLQIVYLCGADRRPDLEDQLRRKAISCQPIVVYQAVGTGHLTDTACTGVMTQELDGVLLYSPRSAALFAQALANCQRELAGPGPQQLHLFCLSPAVAEALKMHWPFAAVPPARLHVAPQPNEQALLQLVARTAALRPNA